MINAVRTLVCAALLLVLPLSQAFATSKRGSPLLGKPAELDDSSWASLPQALAGSLAQEAHLAGSGPKPDADGAAGDRFAHAIAISGDTVVVGTKRKWGF